MIIGPPTGPDKAGSPTAADPDPAAVPAVTPPCVVGLRLARLREKAAGIFDPVAAEVAEVLEELAAVVDRLTYAEAALHHVRAALPPGPGEGVPA